MARSVVLRIRNRTNASIKAHYKKAAILNSQGAPMSLRLTLMGVASRRGGWRLRLEKQRRRLLPFKQLKVSSSTRKLKTLEGTD